MADNHIEIQQAVRLGSMLFSAVSTLRPTHDRIENVKRIMDQVAAGGDWGALEAKFGVPAGKGETVYNLIAGAFTHLDHFDVLTTMDRLG